MPSITLTLMIAMRNEGYAIGFGKLLESETTMKVIGYCINPKEVEVIDRYKELKPTILLIDINMPPLDIYKVIDAILKTDANAKIIGVATFFRDNDAAKLQEIGAKGYMLRDYEVSIMGVIIESVYSDEPVFYLMSSPNYSYSPTAAHPSPVRAKQ